MLSLLNKIYEQNEFEIKENNYNLLFSEKENQEYYITAQYTEDEIKNFFDSEKTNNLISFFEQLKKSRHDIQKNTSLIVCVKVINIEESYTALKNIIFKIEEDEYFFRKYVIVYTENSIKNMDCNMNIKDQLHQIIKKDNMMEEYQKNCYFSEEFFLAIQLFVKLPFLVFEADTKIFTPIEDEIDKIIKVNQLNSVYSKIISFEKNFKKSNDSEYVDKLAEAFLSEKEDNSILDNFFNHFEEI